MQRPASFLLSALLLAPGCRAFDGFAARDQVVSQLDIPYKPGSTNPKHALDLFLPAGKDQAPVIVFIHGGYWITSILRGWSSWAILRAVT
ncbi:MAG: hypothetical protein HY042_10610 [Spirochaetia bacterium]|nr:hypothetical protein [Spirochaetia bacterium]